MKSLRFGSVLLLLLLGVTAASALAPEETGFKMKTSKFFISQETDATASGATLTKTFTIFMGESTPSIKSAFIEIKGIAESGGSNQSIDVKIKRDTDADYSNLVTYTFAVPAKTYHFKINYDVTSFFASKITASGPYTFVLYIKNNGPSSLNIIKAKAILTYNFVPPSSGYRTSGFVVSSTFDSTNANGAAPNSILWKGTLPASAHVKFQFASSNCSNGATNSPTCNSGTWSYVGPDGTSNTYYEPSAPDTAVSVKLADHNNKRYFKYKVILYPTTDLQSTPQVDDIILNWSP